jgi:hypothetical protein
MTRATPRADDESALTSVFATSPHGTGRPILALVSWSLPPPRRLAQLGTSQSVAAAPPSAAPPLQADAESADLRLASFEREEGWPTSEIGLVPEKENEMRPPRVKRRTLGQQGEPSGSGQVVGSVSGDLGDPGGPS